MPVCNVEGYLRQSMDSVLGQTLRDIEVICVDDGSTDGSAAILDAYALADGRVRVLRQENRGAGLARNAGLDMAEGEWLAFLDADDFFDAPMLQEMADAGDGAHADVVACALAARGDMFRRWKGWAWDKLFRRDFVKAEQLRFQDLPVSNDLLFTYSALALARTVVALDRSYVHHRRRAGSVETTRDRSPLAPIAAVRALHGRIGLVKGFAQWVPDFLFWHVNRLKSEDARRDLLAETRRLGREWNIDTTAKWRFEEAKHWMRKMTGRLGA
jgi:glycosyltransferase involved in cell wall biosynthesis